MTKFNFNHVSCQLTKDEIISQFESTFPNADFDMLIEVELEKAELRYKKLLNDFNNGVYNEHNSTCNRDTVAVKSHKLERAEIVDMLEKHENFDLVFNGMWCIEIKQNVFTSESIHTAAIKQVIEYINTKKRN